MKDYLIYRHVNKINGKSYIGQTCNLKRRIGKDGSGYLTKNSKGEYRQIAFANAILKYGWNNFETEILIENLTIEEANFYEEKYIEEYKTCNPNYGYNIRKGTLGKESRKTDEQKIQQFNQNFDWRSGADGRNYDAWPEAQRHGRAES